MTRGHEQHVTAGDGEVRQRIGVAEVHADVPRVTIAQHLEAPLEVVLAAADDDQLPARFDDGVGGVGGEVEAFLPVQAAHDDEDRAVGQALQIESRAQCGLARDFPCEIVMVVMRRQHRVVARIPGPVVDAVDDAGDPVGS